MKLIENIDDVAIFSCTDVDPIFTLQNVFSVTSSYLFKLSFMMDLNLGSMLK